MSVEDSDSREYTLTVLCPLNYADRAVDRACERAISRAEPPPATDQNPYQAISIRHGNVDDITAIGKLPRLLHSYEPYNLALDNPTDQERIWWSLNRPLSGVVIDVYALDPARAKVRVTCKDETMRPFFDAVKVALAQEFPEVPVAPDPREETERRRTAEIECEAARLNLEAAKLKPQAGRRGTRELEHDDRIRRLALAQAAIEIKTNDPKMTWKEAARQVNWPWGGNAASAVKLLEIARSDLAQLEERDPDGLLAEVVAIRKEKKI